MGIMVHPFKWLKLWHLGVMLAIGAVAGLSAYVGFFFFGASQPTDQPISRQVALVEEQTQSREVQVKGRLSFPIRVEMTFGTEGEVGQILVKEGDVVVQGQILARLEDLTVTALQEDLARAQFNLDQNQDALERAKEEFLTTPLERAEFEAEIAQAARSLEDADDKLADFRRDYRQDLADARKAKADSEAALDWNTSTASVKVRACSIRGRRREKSTGSCTVSRTTRRRGTPSSSTPTTGTGRAASTTPRFQASTDGGGRTQPISK